MLIYLVDIARHSDEFVALFVDHHLALGAFETLAP